MGRGGSEAVALFADRARRADAGFTLDGRAGPAVARLVARLDGMPLAIELAAARVEALGVAQLLDRVDDRLGLLVAGDRLAAGRQQSLAAAVGWSYRLLDERERRVLRAVSVFPGPFTLEGAEAVAGADAGPAVLRLVDCSLLSPPRAGPDGRGRYVMLETLRAYGAGLLAEAGEDDEAAAALARYALQVAQQAAAGLGTDTGEAAGARHLDAEDATVRHALAWAAEHDPAMALRLALALAWWWLVRGRLASQAPLLAAAADKTAEGSDAWCAAHIWLGQASLYSAAPAEALRHYTAVRDAVAGRGPSQALATSVGGRSWALLYLGRAAEAAGDGRRCLALAREAGSRGLEALALVFLAVTATHTGDGAEAVRLARQALQVGAEVPGALARLFGHILTVVLTEAGDLAAAEQTCAAGLAHSRDMGDLWNLSNLLTDMAFLDLRAGRGRRTGEAQRPGARADHPGGPGPHRRADRRPDVHQRAHRRFPPGPHPGQDRLPAAGRPDPPRPQHGPGLSRRSGGTRTADDGLTTCSSYREHVDGGRAGRAADQRVHVEGREFAAPVA